MNISVDSSFFLWTTDHGYAEAAPDKRQMSQDKREGGSRLWLRGATLRLKTKVVRQKEGGSLSFVFCPLSFDKKLYNITTLHFEDY